MKGEPIMQLTVHGKQMDVGDALRTHVEEKLEDIKEKYFNRVIEATVTFSPEGSAFYKTHISIRVGKDILVQSTTTAGDVYGAFDAAAEKIAKQLRRYKRKLRDHHQRLEETPENEILKARDYVIAMEQENTPPEDKEPATEGENGEEPVVVAEMTTDIQTMSVSDAVMRMDLSGESALLFRNAKHNGLNMIYRRSDGNVGWVDPVTLEDTGTVAAE